MSKIARLAAGCIALVAATTTGIGGALPGSGNASAYCNGQGNPISWSVGWADETVANIYTCDGLNDYNGKFLDGAVDGTCVYMRYYMDGVWTNTAANCSTSTWKTYSYTDSNSYSPSTACKSSGGCSSQYANQGF
jgi:hypothetical protein